MTDDQAVPGGLRDKVAIALHDADCGDRSCNGSALGAYYRQADTAIVAAAPVLRAQGAAAERERWTARVDAVTVNLTRPRFTAPGQVTEAWIPLSELADLLDGTP